MELRIDVYQAIADPTRRKIIALVAQQSLNLNAIASQFDVSRPAISKHIKILAECGLIIIVQQGRERYCQAKLEPLQEVASWVDQYKQFWSQQLDSLDQYLTDIQSKPSSENGNNL